MENKIIPIKKVVKVLKKYEKGALDQMIKNEGIKETGTVLSNESLENFETIGAAAQFMTVRDIANDLGLLEYFVNNKEGEKSW